LRENISNSRDKRITLLLLTWVIVLVLLMVIPSLVSRFYVYLATEILIMALFALSFNILLGYTGLVSFGHAAYFGIGAYTSGLLLTKASLHTALSLTAAPILSGLAALVIGYFCLRLTHIYFAMLTLAFAQIVWAVAFKWYGFTGGDNGLVGVPVPELLSSSRNFYFFILAVVGSASLLLWKIINSPFGQTLKAIRENPERVEFMGINVRNHQLISFVIAGAFAGLAGGLYSMFNRSVFPDFIFWTKSADVILMTLLGGMYTFVGPAVGAAVLLYLDQFITSYTEYWPMVLGIALLPLIFFFPEGIMGFVQAKFLKKDIETGRGS